MTAIRVAKTKDSEQPGMTVILSEAGLLGPAHSKNPQLFFARIPTIYCTWVNNQNFAQPPRGDRTNTPKPTSRELVARSQSLKLSFRP
jgi:hypothetical protein